LILLIKNHDFRPPGPDVRGWIEATIRLRALWPGLSHCKPIDLLI
jgi:hypothetical protein